MAALLLYGGPAAWAVLVLHGFPARRDVLVPLLLGGMLAGSATSIRRIRRWITGVAVDWAPFMLALWLYDLVHGHAHNGWFPVQYRGQIAFDRLVGGGSIPTVWLQQHLWHGRATVRWYDYGSWLVYVSYFFGTTTVLAVLWWRTRAMYWRFAASVLALALTGCGTFLIFPADPPWLAGKDQLIAPVGRIVGDIGDRVPVITFHSLWEQGSQYANDVAAVPSLHAAYTLLIALFLVRHWRSRWRHALWLYPLAMAFALVYMGEHFLADIVIGWIYCFVAFQCVEHAAARRQTLRSSQDRESASEPLSSDASLPATAPARSGPAP